MSSSVADLSAPEASRRPIYRPMDEFSANDLRSFRGVTFGLGGRLVVGRYISGDGVQEPVPGPARYGAAGTPVVDMLAEFGARRIRFAIGAIVAPVPIGFSDAWTFTLIGVRAGLLVGGERYRFGVTAGGGVWFTWAVMAHAFITPWRDRRGNRHGIGVDAGVWSAHPAMTLSYRFAPAALNHAGGRRAAKLRARVRQR